MQGIRFQRGVLGVERIDNDLSEIYGERARSQQAERGYKEHMAMERRAQLSKNTSSIITNGNILNPDSMSDRVKVNKFYQSKGGDTHTLPFQNTFSRLFCRNEGTASSDARTQALRERDLNGKTYNFITHAGVEHWPVSQSAKYNHPEHKVLSHPSQASLEQYRNLQGSIRRSEFII